MSNESIHLTKKCLGMMCDWKHRCSLYHIPNAPIHFNPQNVGEYCDHFISMRKIDEDESND